MTSATTAAPLDTLPALSEEYSLPAEQVNGFQRDGHVLLRRVASGEEVAAYRPFIEGAVATYKKELPPLEERETYGKAFIQVNCLWMKDEVVRRFVLARRFAKIAAELMGVKAVRLYNEQALFKEPGGGYTPWHQDQYYWPLETDKTVTMWMPLVDAAAEMGTMRFASGSHRLGYLGELPISDESEEAFNGFIAERGLNIANCGAMKAGDATFHAGWTLHGAPGNQTDTMRSVITIIYFADGARVSHDVHAGREADLRVLLPGLKPGDLAATPVNPLVYSE